jgi:hypothetical protein
MVSSCLQSRGPYLGLLACQNDLEGIVANCLRTLRVSFASDHVAEDQESALHPGGEPGRVDEPAALTSRQCAISDVSCSRPAGVSLNRPCLGHA